MVERNDVRRAYDELAAVYAAERTTTGDDPGSVILTEFLASLSDPGIVLDAGCGQGTPVLSELSDVATAVGVDFSREQLKLAANNAPEARLFQGDMTALPLAAASFDVVVAYWSLIHVPMADHQTVIDEFARVLRPGGRVLLCEGTDRWVGENPDWLESGVRMHWNIAGADTTRNQLRSAGFHIVDEWDAPELLASDEESENEDSPWTFFSACLED